MDGTNLRKLCFVLLIVVSVCIIGCVSAAEEPEAQTTQIAEILSVEKIMVGDADNEDEDVEHFYVLTKTVIDSLGRETIGTHVVGLLRHSSIVQDVPKGQPQWAELISLPGMKSIFTLHLYETTNIKITQLARGQSIRM